MFDEPPLSARIFSLAAQLRKSGDESYGNALALTPAEWPLVVTISHNPTSLLKLCQRIRRDTAQVSRIVALLVERGVLIKHKDPHDSRKIIIDINRKDKKLVGEIRRISKQRDQLLTAGISEAERRQVIALLARLESNAGNLRMLDI